MGETITERQAAIETLLLLADADAGWSDYDHALELLTIAEGAAGALPPDYALKRERWSAAQRYARVAGPAYEPQRTRYRVPERCLVLVDQ